MTRLHLESMLVYPMRRTRFSCLGRCLKMLISCSACFRDFSDLTATGAPLYAPRYTVPSPPVAIIRLSVTCD